MLSVNHMIYEQKFIAETAERVKQMKKNETTKNTTPAPETIELINKIVVIFGQSEKSVKMSDLKEVCELCGIAPAKTKTATINLLVDYANEYTAPVENQTADNAENQTANETPETPAPVYSKSDIRNASYRTLKTICTELNIEFTGNETMSELTALVLNSGKLKSGNTARTASGNGINATRKATRTAFLTVLESFINSTPDCSFAFSQKNADGTHNDSRIAVHIGDKCRFTIFAQNKHMNIATRPETIDEINADRTANELTAYTVDSLSYGKQSAFIKEVAYPVFDPENNGYQLPVLLAELFALFGVNIPAVNNYYIPAPATDNGENTDDK